MHNGQPVAVITGAGRGIGKALVEVLLERGYTVVAVVRTAEHVAELSALAGDRVFPILCDVREEATEAKLKSFLDQHVERVDLLVNNAGFGASRYGISGLSYPELDDVLAVHCYGAIRCVRACLAKLHLSSKPTILNMSSRFGSLEWVAEGVVPHDQATYAYRIGKAALNMMTACLAVEMKQEGIRVLAIDPGKVKTRFGPIDADTEPKDAAKAIVDIATSNLRSGLFVNTSGEKLPW